jgi:hypothetical protein
MKHRSKKRPCRGNQQYCNEKSPVNLPIVGKAPGNPGKGARSGERGSSIRLSLVCQSFRRDQCMITQSQVSLRPNPPLPTASYKTLVSNPIGVPPYRTEAARKWHSAHHFCHFPASRGRSLRAGRYSYGKAPCVTREGMAVHEPCEVQYLHGRQKVKR